MGKLLRSVPCLSLFGLSLCMVAMLAGCRNQTSTIAVIPRTTSTLLWEPMHLGVAENTRDTGLHVDWNAPEDEGDSERQLNIFAAAIHSNVRGVIFVPDETLASRNIVLQAVAQRIPIVIVDDELGPPASQFLSYVSNDEVAGAKLAAERLNKVLHGSGTIAVMGISSRLESGVSREVDFERALAVAAPGIEIKLRRFGDSVITHQQQIAQEILNSHEHIDAIVALTATATRGAYYARIATEPHPAMTILGFDQDLLAPVQLGEVDSVIVQNTRRIGQLAAQNLKAQMRGEDAPGLTLVPPLLLTQLTMNSPTLKSLWTHVQTSPAESEDIDAIHRDGIPFPAPQLSSMEPYDAAALKRYAALVKEEAKKHEIQPGVQPILTFLMSPGIHPNVTVQGVIISKPPLTAIQDESGALSVPDVDPQTHLKLGDVVEAVGTVVSERFRSRIENAKIRVLWSDNEIPPLAVTAAQLTVGTYRGRSIEVEGTLKSASIHPGSYDLVLQDGEQTFRVLGAKDFHMDPRRLELGGRLRIKGTATSIKDFTGGIYPFTVVTDRIDIISPPPWWSPRHIMLLVCIGIACFLLAQFLIHRVQTWHMRSLLREREQLAFEMHDTLAQSFTGIAYQLQAASIERRGESMMLVHIRHALDMVHASHREASRTIAALRPQYRDAEGILYALKELAERLSDGGPLVIRTEMIGKLTALPLEVTDVFVRIGQEAISNAIQHSGCNLLTISLTLSRREAQLCVHDDGCGFKEQTSPHGLGIAGMMQRAARIKARFDLRTIPQLGTTITATAQLPLGSLWRTRLGAVLSAAIKAGTRKEF